MYSLVIILILNIIPSLTSGMEGDYPWHIYLITLLTIIVVQALYIYRLTPRKSYLHILAFFILVISIWDFLDYVALTVMGWR